MADEAESKTTSSFSVIGPSSVRKEDTAALIMNGTEAYPDDTFSGLYVEGSKTASKGILEPFYKPGTLYAMTSQNNILLQCIEAMEVNIDGTGHSIDLIDKKTENLAEKEMLEDFFQHPYPGKSLVSIRRSIRRDLEATGNGYMEVIRNVQDEVMLLNHLDANYTRLVALDEAIVVDRQIKRKGKVIPIQIRARERRFVQRIGLGGTTVYFKEFGSKRDLNRETGDWAPVGQRLPLKLRASEVHHFVGNKEPKTAYGSPRWINQLPSVLGSRKAEEHNLDFFDSGGIPPVLIIVQGGTLGDGVKEAISAHLSGKGAKHRASVVEASSNSGDISSTGTVQVRVERFGAERQQDAMFQKYDQATEDHVRVAFRLPPLFLGKAADYNFATAYTAYMIAEAQVFGPEREEFDNFIQENIVSAMGAENYRFRSLPMTLTDVQNQLKALEMVADKFVDGESVVSKLNEITGLGLEYSKQESVIPPGMVPGVAPGMAPTAAPQAKGQVLPFAKPPAKKADYSHLHDLVDQFAEILDPSGVTVCSTEEQVAIQKAVSDLPYDEYLAFSGMLAQRNIDMVWASQDDLAELCGCAVHLGV